MARRKRPELMGPGEVRVYLQISRPTLATYRQRADFPKPVAELEIGPVWLAADVRAWNARRQSS